MQTEARCWSLSNSALHVFHVLYYMGVVGGRLQGAELVGYDLGWQKRQSHRLPTDTVYAVYRRCSPAD